MRPAKSTVNPKPKLSAAQRLAKMKSLFKKMVKSTIVTNREKKAAATAVPPPTESQKAKKTAEDDKLKQKQQAKAAAPAVEAAQPEALPDLAENNDALDGASYSKDDGKDLVTLEDEYVAALNENRHLEEERALLLQLVRS